MRPAALGGVCALLASCTLTSLDGLTGGTRKPSDAGAEAAAIADSGAPDASHPPVDASHDVVETSTPDAADAAPEAQSGPCYLADGLVPTQPDTTDGVPYELGTRVRPTMNVTATKMRFWKAPSEPSGPHTGTLWTVDGTIVTTAALAGAAASGWIEGTFATPAALMRGQDYLVTVAVTSYYPATTDFFATTDLVCPNGKLVAPMDTAQTHNGMFGTPGALPNMSFRSAFYFVDLYVE